MCETTGASYISILRLSLTLPEFIYLLRVRVRLKVRMIGVDRFRSNRIETN